MQVDGLRRKFLQLYIRQRFRTGPVRALRYYEDTLVCHPYTVRRSLRLLTAASAIVAAASLCAQTQQPNWRKIGNSAVELGLASPATGPASAVWFSPDGSQLFARTQSGKTFVSADLENWTVAPPDSLPRDRTPVPAVHHLPENRALVRAGSTGRTYALGSNIYASDDGGRTWINLTGYNDKSVIGAGEHDLAVSPRDPNLVVVANDFGVWRSNDGGLSWSGLNENLPNLAVREIVNAS
ncbi:MAG: hypothetical protein JWO80_927, partial [Bryobacterales bacterium]|nr:hypothetical protein [Bryobacterales bacterium]